MRVVVRAWWVVVLVLITARMSSADPVWVTAPPTRTPGPVGTRIPEIAPPFGRVVYRAAKVASLESLAVTMIACRHRDPVPRRFGVQFFDRLGRMIGSADDPISPPVPAGKKVVFVTDGMYFKNRGVLNIRLGHLSIGAARVVSDASILHCVGKMRMDAGLRDPSYRDEIGLVREGEPLPVLPERWVARPRPSPRR